MYQNRVKNDRIFFEILTLLQGNQESGKIQYILNFPTCTLDFLIHKIKEWEFQNSFCHSLPYFIHTMPKVIDETRKQRAWSAALTQTQSLILVYKSQ